MASNEVSPSRVSDVLDRWVARTGVGIVCDLDKSHGAYIHDANTGLEYLDFSGSFAARPLAFDHAGLKDAAFRDRLAAAACHRISSRHVYSVDYARFVEVFAETACEGAFSHFVFAQAEPAAVGIAARAALSWKSRKNAARGIDVPARRLISFAQASGGSVRCCPRFVLSDRVPGDPCVEHLASWFEVSAPVITFPYDDQARGAADAAEARTLAEIDGLLAQYPGEFAGLLIEPIQTEAGDRHFRGEFFASLRSLADERELLLIFDEVNCGMGATGRWWGWQNHDVKPDLMIFGGRSSVGGVAATERLDEVERGHFHRSYGGCGAFEGNVVDMIRTTRVIELIASEGLLDNARVMGAYLVRLLEELAESHESLEAVRGRGMCVAFDLPDRETRDRFIECALEQELLVLSGGDRTVRLRPTLDIDADAVARGIAQLEAALRRTQQRSRR